MRSGPRRMLMILVAVSIGALAFVYRFNTLSGPLAGFDNDHFFQIVRADAMLDGELPLRDYADTELRSLWPPLTYATSATAMRIMGRSLRSEALLGVGMLALGAAATFWAAATIAPGIVPAAIMTLLAIALGPTLYNYPKIVPYAIAVIAMLAYARRPGVRRLLVLSLVVAVATLYRHDHGVFLAIPSAVLILLVNGRRAAGPLAACAVFVLMLVLPGLLFAQQHGGVISYLRECLNLSSREASRTTGVSLPFQIDRSLPLLARVPPPVAPPPRIAVRWTETVDPDARARAEQELGLTDPETRGDNRNWSYVVEDPSFPRLARIVRDARVADTDGIERDTFVLTAVPLAPPPRGGLFGWRVAPGILREANAAPWLRLVAWSVVIASLVSVGWPRLRHVVERPDVPAAVIAAIGVLGVLLCLVFLRNPGAFRLADVSVPVAVLGAWLLTAIAKVARASTWPVRAGTALIVVTTLGLTTLSVGAVGAVPRQIAETGVGGGLEGIAERWGEVWGTLGGLPGTTLGVDEKLGSAARYLQRCSVPTDRVLIADYVPELHYFSRRGFAAGQMVFFGGFYTSAAAQRRAIERWMQQSVPIALMQPGDRFGSEFGSDYPDLAAYLRAHYRKAGILEVREGMQVDVWVTSDREATTDALTGLPCFGQTAV